PPRYTWRLARAHLTMLCVWRPPRLLSLAALADEDPEALVRSHARRAYDCQPLRPRDVAREKRIAPRSDCDGVARSTRRGGPAIRGSPFGSLASRRAVVRWSDGTEGNSILQRIPNVGRIDERSALPGVKV